ncbi:tetratricopeptide repeat protein [Candidatus Infernicultor aquiphilus]|uniref:tetratricopeptide repeat protein n=1 Tax=Candidatus Infernicultor aquiphilus TaxID=1805029 RepID=UPI0026A5B8B4
MFRIINKIKKIKNAKGLSPVILLLLSFLLILNGCLFLPNSKGGVEGYVYEKTVLDSRPLEDALISITGSSNTALTDSEGYFHLDEVSIGARTLTIAKESYITYRRLSVVIKEDEVTLIDNGNPIVVRAVDDKYLFDGGVIYYNMEDYNNAITTFQQLINDYPDSEYADEAQYYIGSINEKKLGYYIQALLEYQKLIDNYPNSEFADDAQLGTGNCYYATKDYSHAIEAYQKVIDDYPDSSLLPLAQYSIGQSYRKLTNYEQAILEFTKTIENYPESEYAAPAQYYIASSYYDAQDYNQAILEFQKTVDNFPDSAWPGESETLIAPCAQYYIGYCYGQKLGQWEEAIPAYQLIIDNYPNSTWPKGQEIPPDSQYQIGWCYEQLELWCEAVASYQLVIDNYPGATWSEQAEERLSIISGNCLPG